ncbi:MAG: hypothetical protein AB7G93_08790 [Bdellovibrionales bacterium]
MRGLLGFLLFATAGASAETFFRLPSMLTLEYGVGEDRLQTALANAVFSLRDNWQVDLGADQSRTQIDGDVITATGFRLGGGTDPLGIYSGRLSYETWRIPSHVRAHGLRVSGTYSPLSWLFTLEYIHQTIRISGLPETEAPSGQADVLDRGLVFRVSTFAVSPWNFYFLTGSHSYDKDLVPYAEAFTTSSQPLPNSVLSTLSAINDSEMALGAAYFFKRFQVGAELGHGISALDQVKTLYVELNGAYEFTRNFSANTSVTSYKPVGDAQDTSASYLATGGVTYFWR